MDGDLVTRDVLEDAVVGGRRPARIVFRRQTVHRHDDLQALERTPLRGNRTNRAGHELRVDPARRERRQDAISSRCAPAARRRQSRHGTASADQSTRMNRSISSSPLKSGDPAASLHHRGDRLRRRSTPDIERHLGNLDREIGPLPTQDPVPGLQHTPGTDHSPRCSRFHRSHSFPPCTGIGRAAGYEA